MACLEFSGRVSVYASVVNWFLSSRQSPTVGRIAAPLLAVVGRYNCRHRWQRAVTTALVGKLPDGADFSGSGLGHSRKRPVFMADKNVLMVSQWEGLTKLIYDPILRANS